MKTSVKRFPAFLMTLNNACVAELSHLQLPALISLGFGPIKQKQVPQTRQTIDTPDLFSSHPPAVTDGFPLHIKATILIGKVARFNSRFLRTIAKQNRAGRTMSSDGVAVPRSGEVEYVDPRGQEQFLELENHLRIFRGSLYPAYGEYMSVNKCTGEAKVDANLYAAHIIPAAWVEEFLQRGV
jgi:hypothetical protein